MTWDGDAQRDTGSALVLKRTAIPSEPAEAVGLLDEVCNRGLHADNTFGRDELAEMIQAPGEQGQYEVDD